MVPVAAVPIAETIVDAGEATVEPAAVKSTGVKSAAMEPAAVKSATMETATTVASTSAMRSVGEVWRAERSNAQHGSCGASQSPSYPGPGAIFG